MEMLRIVSAQDGFRRCGVAHSVEPKDYPMDRFSDREREIMKNDPMLYVHVVDDEESPIGKGGPDFNEVMEEAQRVAASEKSRAEKAEAALAEAEKATASEKDRADQAEAALAAAEKAAAEEKSRADQAEAALAEAEKASPGDKGKTDAKK